MTRLTANGPWDPGNPFSPCPHSARYPAGGPWVLPAEIQKGPRGGRHSLVIPAQEVELRHRASLVGLKVLQIKAPHEEILAPDVFRDQMHLGGGRADGGVCVQKQALAGGPAQLSAEPHCGEGWGPRGTWRAGDAGEQPRLPSQFQRRLRKRSLGVFFVLCFLNVTLGHNSQITGKTCYNPNDSFLSFLSHVNLQQKSPEKNYTFEHKRHTRFHSH